MTKLLKYAYLISEETYPLLRNHPEFKQIRRLIQSNTNYLPAFLDQLRESNPRLLRVSPQIKLRRSFIKLL